MPQVKIKRMKIRIAMKIKRKIVKIANNKM